MTGTPGLPFWVNFSMLCKVYRSNFIIIIFFFACEYPIFPATCVEETVFFLLWMVWPSCQKSCDHRCENLILGSLVASVGLYVCPYVIIAVLITLISFEVTFESASVRSPTLLFVFNTVLAVQNLLRSMWILGWDFLFLKKKVIGIWYRLCWIWDCFG